MKNNRIIALILAVLALLALVSCGKDTGKGDENAIPKYDTALIDDWQDYTIVYPDEASVEVSDALTALRTAISEKYGVSLPIKSDFKIPTDDVPVGTLEILIGATNREESISTIESMKANDFTVAYKNNRIVITGGSDKTTVIAIEHFIDYLLQDDGINVPAATSFTLKGDYTVGTLTIGGVDIREFQIVRGSGMNAAERIMTEQLRESIASICGHTINVVVPSDPEKANEILIGNTSRPETSTELPFGTYAVNQTDSKLALYGNGDYSNAFVIKLLIDKLYSIPKSDAYDITFDNVASESFTPPTLTATNLPVTLKNYSQNPEYNTDFTKIENVLARFSTLEGELPEEISVLEKIDVNDYPLSLKNQYYVATDGNDENPGTLELPFATLTAALRKVANAGGGVIWVRGGTYSLNTAVAIGATHSGSLISPLFIKAYGDEAPVFTTAKSIDASAFTSVNYENDKVASRIDPSVQNSIGYVNLYELGFAKKDLGEISESSMPKIYINGELGHIARYPNADQPELYFDTVLETGSVTSSSGSNLYRGWIKRVNNWQAWKAAGGTDTTIYSFDKTAYSSIAKALTDAIKLDAVSDTLFTDNSGNKNLNLGWEIKLTDLTPLEWENTGNIFFRGSVFENWAVSTFRIKSFDLLSKKMTSVNGGGYGAKHSTNSPTGYNTYYLYNAIEALDAPGEWFLDYSTGNLYMYTGENFASSEILFVTTEANILNITNASNVVIDGLAFESSFKCGVYAENSDQVVIQNCTVSNTAENGICFQSMKNSAAIYNDISATGSTMIEVSSRSTQYTLEPSRNIIQNNYLHDGLPTNQGGIHLSGTLNVISHNYLEYCQIGLDMTSECIIEYNELYGGSRYTHDAGIIYGGGYYNFGNHIRYNYMHHWASPGKAIYFDDLACRNYAYYNLADTTGGDADSVNMLYSSSGHYNIFLGNICIGRTTDYIGESCLYFSDKSALGYRWTEHSNGFMTAFSERYNMSNLYKRFPEFEQYYNMMKAHTEERTKAGYVRNETEIYLRSPAHNVYMNNLMLGLTDIRIPLTKETNSVTGENMESLTLVKDNFASKNIELFMPGYLNNDYTVDPAALDEIKEVIPSFYMPEYERAGITYER